MITLITDVDRMPFSKGIIYMKGKGDHVAVLFDIGPEANRYKVLFYRTRAEYSLTDVEKAITVSFSEFAEAEAYAIAWVDRKPSDQGLRIWDNGGLTADRFSVRLGADIYAMSSDANQPNGVCMYVMRGDYTVKDGEAEVTRLNDLPAGVQRQIAFLAYRDSKFGN